MFLDLHIHTKRYSACSILSPEEMLEVANGLELDGLVIVEHGKLWSEAEIEELKRHPKAGDLVILRGQEIRTYGKFRLQGDVLVFGLEKSIRDQKLSAQNLVQRVHEEGGVAVAAHPYRGGFGLGNRIYKLELDGIEVLNGNCTPDEMRQAKEAQEKLQLAATGGSDAHSVDAVGNYLTWFPEPVTTEAELVAAIKQRRCRPADGEELLANG